MGRHATVAGRMAASAAARGRVFTKLAREIMVAARTGSDPNFNSKLRLAVDRARDNNMPKDVIDSIQHPPALLACPCLQSLLRGLSGALIEDRFSCHLDSLLHEDAQFPCLGLIWQVHRDCDEEHVHYCSQLSMQ